MAKTVNIDFKEISDNITKATNDAIEFVKKYFDQVTLFVKIAWGAVGAGLILIILAFIV